MERPGLLVAAIKMRSGTAHRQELVQQRHGAVGATRIQGHEHLAELSGKVPQALRSFDHPTPTQLSAMVAAAQPAMEAYLHGDKRVGSGSEGVNQLLRDFSLQDVSAQSASQATGAQPITPAATPAPLAAASGSTSTTRPASSRWRFSLFSPSPA